MGIQVITGLSKGITPVLQEPDAQQRHGNSNRRLVNKQNLVLVTLIVGHTWMIQLNKLT
jgi:hypothetical protein